jgi:hypothetical protein
VKVKVEEGLGYEFRPPEGWRVQPGEGGDLEHRDRLVLSPRDSPMDFQERIFVNFEPMSSDTRTLAENRVRQFENRPDFHLYRNATETTVGLSPEPNAYTITYSYRNPQWGILKITETITKLGKYALMIGYSSTEQTYNQFHSVYLDFLSTVKFNEG